MAKTINGKEIEKGSLAGYLFWAMVHSPQRDDKVKGKEKYIYRVNLVLENEDGTPVVRKNAKTGEMVNMVEEAKRLGLKIKKPDHDNNPDQQEWGRFVNIKREIKFSKLEGLGDDLRNEKLAPIPCKYAKSKQTIGPDVLIGNGSFGVVAFNAIPYPAGEGYAAGITAYLNGITVVKLEQYSRESLDEDDYDFSEDTMTDPKEVKKSKVADTEDDELDPPFEVDNDEEDLK